MTEHRGRALQEELRPGTSHELRRSSIDHGRPSGQQLSHPAVVPLCALGIRCAVDEHSTTEAPIVSCNPVQLISAKTSLRY